MGAAKKFKDNYPREAQNQEDKRQIQAYIEQIKKLLESPENQKKAAHILERMINKDKKY